MRRYVQLPVVILVGGLAAACANTGQWPKAPVIPESVRAVAVPRYYLQPGDTISLRFLLNPELNEDITVGADGHISTAVAPDLIAAGKTIPELRAELISAYAKTVSKPMISVEVKTFAATRVFVGGEVGLPGQFETVGGPPLRLSQAIARAGGLKPSGDAHRVFIIRAPSQGSTPTIFSTDYDKVTDADDPSADVTLAPFDMVYVPKTGVAVAYSFWNQYVQQWINPSFGFSYLINPGNSSSVVTPGATTAAPVATPVGTR